MPNQGYAESARSMRIRACEGPQPYSLVDNCAPAEELQNAGQVCAAPEVRLSRKARLLACGSTLMVGAACLAVVVCKIGWTTFRSEHAESVQLDAVEKCHTAEPGDSCHYDIEYAQSRYLNDHPDWYPGLNVNSSFKDIQYFLHHQKDGHGKARCPRPCGYNLATEKSKTSIHAPEHCHTARGGESCYTHVKYTSKQIPQHPDWYLGLTVDSTFKEVQEYLSRQVTLALMVGAACLAAGAFRVGWTIGRGENAESVQLDAVGKCHTAEPRDSCYSDIEYAQSKYLKDHPDWYPGLNVNSSFKDIQYFLHHQKDGHGKPRCPRPCGYNATKEKKTSTHTTKHCHTARGGESCYTHVKYTSKQISQHPDWYLGLTVNSTFKEVQNYLSRQVTDTGAVCPRPCGPLREEPHQKNATKKEMCRTALQGDRCYNAVKWVRHIADCRLDIQRSPRVPVQASDGHWRRVPKTVWAPAGKATSPAKERNKKGDVPHCSSRRQVLQCCQLGSPHRLEKSSEVVQRHHLKIFTRRCAGFLVKAQGFALLSSTMQMHDVRAGSECYSHVAFTLKELPEHPNWYPGLGTKSSFKEVQAYLHEEIDKGGRVCPKPCGLHAHSSAADVPATAASTEGLGASEDAGEAASQPKPGSNHNHSHGSDCHTARAGESCYDQVLWAMHAVNLRPEWYMGFHTARAGESCYDQVLWAMHAVNLRPEWYMGLSNKSRFVDFQEFLHRGRKDDEGKRCPRPCRLSAVTSLQSAKACHTAVQGEPCWNDVTRIHNEVLDQSKSHAGVSPSSTFEDIQLMLSKQADSHCDHMPCPCHTATEGEECFRHVEWVRTEGIKKHPARFAGLTSESAVEEIQYRLHPVAADHCLLPCAAPWHESQSQLI
eukprot:CAMPEP_0172784492 /NCGR_PEP_ID=MMETSP1074-20121228/204963_1 /TAXON_ID=2916 /ORGANISM="Ceratium fusus, Strain PA161109" /LENGTH=879 /DNA_ID=CAMNT_0013621495 /DNA_START=370 /DNA_END=3011 /DNA_ORIENTATION=+